MSDEATGGRRGGRPSGTLVALLSTVAVVLAAGLYNNAAAPPASTAYAATLSALDGGPDATERPQIALEGPEVAIGSHHLLDTTAKRFLPLSGGASFAANATGIRSATANGDAFAWIEPGPTTTIHVRDFGLATSSSVEVPSALEPGPGPLVVSRQLVAWGFLSNGEWRVAGFLRSTGAPAVMVLPLAGNLTPLAAAGSYLVLAQEVEARPLWAFDHTTSQLRQLAAGDGIADVAAGEQFVAWVNRSVPQAEYFDTYSGAIDTIPLPEGVRAQWLRASPTAVLIGGVRGGLFGDTPRSSHYDFPTGNVNIYSNLGTDVTTALSFGLAGDTLVAVTGEQLPRESAPFTPHLLAVALGGMLVTVYLGTRDAFQGQE